MDTQTSEEMDLCPLRGEIRRLYFNPEEMKIKFKYRKNLLHHISRVYKSTTELEPEKIREIINSIEFLVRKGVDINARDLCGWTPLVRCIIHSMSYEVIEKLLMLGANPNIVDYDGWNALHRVVDYQGNENEVLELVRLLLRAGVNCEAKTIIHGKTPLMLLVTHRLPSHLKVVEELLDHGADPNTIDNNSNSPLYKVLTEYQNYHRYFNGENRESTIKKVSDIIILLLLYGADPSLLNNKKSLELRDKIFVSLYKSPIDSNFFDVLKLLVVDEHFHEYVKLKLRKKRRQIELGKIDEYVIELNELNELKLYNLTGDFSLHTLCTTRDRQELGSIYKTVSSLPNMSRIVEDIKQLKHYSRLLETRLRMGEKYLMEECVVFYSGKVVLNCYCMERIFSYLDEEGMRKLMFVSRQQRECRVGALQYLEN